MKGLDRALQKWRIAKAARHIPPGARVLDIGGSDGALFEQLAPRIGPGVGIDPTLKSHSSKGPNRLISGFFPADLSNEEPFDVIAMLAVLEHFPEAQYAALREGCRRYLKPGGRLVITVPSPFVDHILKVLKTLRLIDGMSLEEHHGYNVQQTSRIFSPPDFRLLVHRSFQLGLNHLFVFERVS
jgi:2-polyprenyl-3-methyl-5-hydroxy-6-metoxy-1,4-benzoquinol methylase